MVRRTGFLLALTFLVAATLHAQDEELYSTLLPAHLYTFTIKKSHSGNDGYKDLIPQASEQTVVLETGGMADDALPVTLRVDRAVNSDRKAMSGTALREWTFRFRLRGDGALLDLTTESSDGELPENLTRSVLAGQLRDLLFNTRLQLGPQPVSVPIIVARRPAADGTVAVTYEMTPRPTEPSPEGAPTSVSTAGGTAVHSPALTFYTQRTHIETSRMFMPPDPASGEQRVVTMTVTTVYSVRVEAK